MMMNYYIMRLFVLTQKPFRGILRSKSPTPVTRRTEREECSMNDNPGSSRRGILRDARKQITRSLILALAALGVIVFACYAWFASNNSVTGRISGVHLKTSRFELASVGSEGKYDSQLPDEEKLEGAEWGENAEGRITDSHKTILWRISNDSTLKSTLNNHRGGPAGIEPGTSGTLQFWVIPKDEGTINLTVSLELIPQKLVDNQFNPVDDDPVALQFLKGHLMVSYRIDDAETATLILPDAGSFPMELGTDPVLVSLDWHWPFLLEEALQKDIGTFLTQNPQYYLCNEKNIPVTEISTALPDPSDPEFRKYSNYYNNADQYIGNSMKAILFRVTVEE